MSNLTNITTTVAAMQDNELSTMSTEHQQLRDENKALKQVNLRLNQQLDEQTKLTTVKTRELEKLRSEMNMFDGLQEASTVCYKLKNLYSNVNLYFNILNDPLRHATSNLR